MSEITIRDDYQRGQVVGLLCKDIYGLVLANEAGVVQVMVLATASDSARLLPTPERARWAHRGIYLMIGIPNSMSVVLEALAKP